MPGQASDRDDFVKRTAIAIALAALALVLLYAACLAEYLETLRPSPQEISWLDLELYQVFAAARNEYLINKEKNSGQAKNNPRL